MSNNYELQVCEDSYSVIVDEVQYFLSQENGNELPLIQNQKQSLLMKINLEEMLKNLLNCTKLLDVVYCSVAGIGTLPGRVSQLQTSLLQTVSDSELTMNSFVRSTSKVLSDLSEVYPCLGDGDYQSAVSILQSVKNVAKAMENAAIEIRDAFQARCDETASILQDAFHSNQEFLDHRDQTTEELTEMNAELEALEVLKTILETQVETMNEEYKALEKKEEQAADRAFGLELTGAILGGLGELVTTVLPIKDLVGGITPEPSAEATSTPDPVDDSQIAQNEEVRKSKQKKDDLETREKQLDQDIEALKKELSDPSITDLEKKRQTLKEKETEREQLEQDIKTQEKTIEKVSGALKAAGSSFTTAASHEQTSVEAYNKRLEELARLRHEMAQQDAENKAKIAKYKAKIASSIDHKKDLDLTIQSLTMAIGSMRRIVTILNETILFWKGVVVCCETLADSELAAKIEEAEQTESKTENRFYEKRLFIKPFLLYFIQWQALRLISNEYVDSMDTVRKSLAEAMAEKEGTREEQWNKAAAKAQTLDV